MIPFTVWHVKFRTDPQSIYKGKCFTLKFTFDDNYPIEAPEVVFIGKIPLHEHVYSNGFICISILYDDWTAAMNVKSVTLSIASMINKGKELKKPFNDESFVKKS